MAVRLLEQPTTDPKPKEWKKIACIPLVLAALYGSAAAVEASYEDDLLKGDNDCVDPLDKWKMKNLQSGPPTRYANETFHW
mmetsp:Transcript_29554/g.71108  ORF Transcript_29554/g.71108 Transcript_29554/m.71108 type:complete len:81 (-) Transcript_29554:1519-1761(-)